MAKIIGKLFDGNFPVVQTFGQNPNRYAQFGIAGHDGIDFAMPENTPIFAGIKGRVFRTGSNPNGYGIYLQVFSPGYNLLVNYAHLNVLNRNVGDEVFPFTIIGFSGNTGFSTGPHLHIGVAQTDSGGFKVNRENGYDGWIDPTPFLDLSQASTTPSAGQPSGETKGVTPTVPLGPPYAPSFAGQTVSSGGNSFRSDDGKTWIFQGSDAARAAAQKANDARELAAAEAAAVDAGVYLQKANLVRKFASVDENASDYGLADAKYVIIRGPYKATVYSGYRGGGSVIAAFSGKGTYALPDQRVGSIRGEVILPPAAPPLPSIPVSSGETPGGTSGGETTVPGVGTAAGYTPWGGAKQPTHKNIFNLIARATTELLSLLKK